jgi:hypothetical protein
MRGPTTISAIVVAACAILVGMYLVNPNDDNEPSSSSSCPYHKESCYFTESYISARSNFRTAARDANATLHVLQISNVPDLTIDVAVLDDDNDDNDGDYEAVEKKMQMPTLVHLSGVHGVEGYAGSAIQLALLHSWTNSNSNNNNKHQRRGARVVLVHAVNPYGYHCGRRFNEDNIDLNRNVLSHAEFHDLISESSTSNNNERRTLYNNHEWMFNWRQPYQPIIDDIRYIMYAIYGIVVLGLTTVKRAVVSGQYHQPTGLFYGGGERGMMAKSHQLLIPLLQQVTSLSFVGIIIDVHTGLGPSGVDTLIPEFGTNDDNNSSSRNQWEALHAIFGGDKDNNVNHNNNIYGTDFLISAASPTEDTQGASSGYEYARGTTGRYLEHFNWNRSLFLTQEFGTYPSPIVLRGMVIERAEWLFGSKNDNDAMGCNGTTARGARAVTNVFYVKTPRWQRKVVQRGVRVVEQALHALVDNNGEKVPLTNH